MQEVLSSVEASFEGNIGELWRIVFGLKNLKKSDARKIEKVRTLRGLT